jgi:hypothetical protein
MEAEEDAERLLRRTEKRAFAAFKISFYVHFLSVDNSPMFLSHTSWSQTQFFVPGVCVRCCKYISYFHF